jgi:hypothetical protein
VLFACCIGTVKRGCREDAGRNADSIPSLSGTTRLDGVRRDWVTQSIGFGRANRFAAEVVTVAATDHGDNGGETVVAAVRTKGDVTCVLADEHK